MEKIVSKIWAIVVSCFNVTASFIIHQLWTTVKKWSSRTYKEMLNHLYTWLADYCKLSWSKHWQIRLLLSTISFTTIPFLLQTCEWLNYCHETTATSHKKQYSDTNVVQSNFQIWLDNDQQNPYYLSRVEWFGYVHLWRLQNLFAARLSESMKDSAPFLNGRSEEHISM